MNTSIGVRRFSGLLFMTGLLFAYRPLAEAQANKAAPKISYIAVASRLETHLKNPKEKPTYTVVVNGVTNLPEGSRLSIFISDYIGQGSTTFNDEVITTVSPTGEFTAEIHSRPGKAMRANLPCSVAFFPDQQPAQIRRKFGKRGEMLNGPQQGGNSGGAYLDAITVVTE